MSTPQLRWSAVKDCPRKAVYDATGAPARERSDREERILYRGRSLGRDYGDFLAARDGAENILREVKVEWELGVGHIDLVHVPTQTAIEVLSSAFAGDAQIQSKLLQLVGYMEHYPAAKAGLLVVLNPSDFSEERFPVARGTDAYQALVDEMRNRIHEVERWRDESVLPERVCRKPADAIGHFCLHADHCFTGWEAPDPDAELAGERAIAAASRASALKAAENEAGEIYKLAKEARQAAEHALDDLIPVGGRYAVGPYTVVRTDVVKRPTLDFRKAELAGVLNLEVLSEFMKPGAAYSTWKVTGTELPPPASSDHDFGDEAPWTEADLQDFPASEAA